MMTRCQLRCTAVMCVALVCLAAPRLAAATDPLPSWRAGHTKDVIVQFVESVSRSGDANFVPAAQRIVTFDNDGTLWAEMPRYFPLIFAIDRLRAIASAHPEWRQLQPFEKVLQDDAAVLDYAEMRDIESMAFLGVSPEEFQALAHTWLLQARHPQLQRAYRDLTYVPMLELLAYLRQHEFTVYICSGAETEFVRPMARDLYGVASWQVIGTTMQMALRAIPDMVRLERLGDWLLPLCEGPGKVLNIQRHIGERPIMAVGNSNGDIEMLQFVAQPNRPSLALLLQHDDAAREFAYAAGAERALETAAMEHWQVVSMRHDFARLFNGVR